MNKLTETELLDIPFSKFLKLEFPRFVLRTLNIVDSYNPELLKINVMFDLLEAEKPRIAKLKDKYGPHPLTIELVELREMRTLYIGALRFHLKKKFKENKKVFNEDLKIANTALNHFFNNLDLSKHEEMFNHKVTQFFEELDANEELENALTNLEFSTDLDKLRSVQSTMQEVINAKLRSVSKRKGETTAQLKNAVLKATKNLFKQMDIAPFLNPELDYTPLFNDLNQLITDYINMINKRILFNKKKAENAKNEESSEMTTTKELNNSVEDVTPLNEEDVPMNELEIEPDKIEKAAAMISKSMQLPDVENKA